jgi:opacity protein-like surface antigen
VPEAIAPLCRTTKEAVVKNISVVLLSVFSLAFAGYAEAAKPKKRTRNANRVGAYGVGAFGQSHYTGDQSQNEEDLEDTLVNSGNPIRNLTITTEQKDWGYQASFGYRFTRYFQAEIGLAQFGSVESIARSEMDFGPPNGYLPVNLKVAFSTGGPIMSAMGVLPLNDKFELLGRVGYMFTSSERELTSNVNGQTAPFFSAKGDSQNLVLGAGAAVHFGQIYSARLEYLKIDGLGEGNRTGEEDLNVISLGVVVRF